MVGVISNPQSSLIIPGKEAVPWLTRSNVLFVKKKLFSVEVASELRG